MQCVIITGSLQFNTMRTMCRHNWLNVLVKHKVVFSWSLLLPHNTSYCGQESASGMPCILVLINPQHACACAARVTVVVWYVCPSLEREWSLYSYLYMLFHHHSLQ